MSLRNKLCSLLALTLVLFSSNLLAVQPGEFGDTVSEGGGVWLTVLFWTVILVLIGQGLVILGRLLQVYNLSTESAGTKKRFPCNATNASLFLIMLVAGLYCTCWEVKVHGALTLRAA